MALRCRESSGALGEAAPGQIRAALAGMIDKDGMTVLRSEKGMLAGFLMPAWDAPGWMMAVEFIWWAEDGQWMPLLRRFEEWAREQGADEVRIASKLQPDSERIARVFGRAGYEAREICYRKVI